MRRALPRSPTRTRDLPCRFVAVTGPTPLRRLHHQRVHRAQELSETTDDAVEHIAARTGMGAAGTLRRHLHRGAQRLQEVTATASTSTSWSS